MSSQPSYEVLPARQRGLTQTVLIRFFSFFISAYQYCLSPLLGNHCRFTPGCSSYMKEALHRHGVIRGLFLGTRRVCSCHPFHEGGLDPVPEKFSFIKQKKQ